MRSTFSPDQAPHLVRTTGRAQAFVPPPLPPSINFDTTLVTRLSAADRALGELAGAGRALPSPTLFVRALLRREAVLSSRIEGTQATLSDLVLFEIAQNTDTTGDVHEVTNYVHAMDFLLDEGRMAPLGLWLLREAHRILLTGVHGDSATPGQFRDQQNWIGSAGADIHDATYVPPPPEHLSTCLDSFESHLRGPRHLPPLIEIACLHYQFEAIHPFHDGNGRVGRLLVALLLVEEWGLLPGPLLDFSAYIEGRRDEYYARLLAVSTSGDWSGWLSFFLDAVAAQSADVLRRVRDLQNLRDRYRERVTGARSTSLLPKLVDAVFETPALTLTSVQEILGVTHRAAAVNVARLVEEGVLTEIPRAGRTRRFVAQQILRVVNGEIR